MSSSDQTGMVKESGFHSMLEFMSSYGLKIYDDDDYEEAKTILRTFHESRREDEAEDRKAKNANDGEAQQEMGTQQLGNDGSAEEQGTNSDSEDAETVKQVEREEYVEGPTSGREAHGGDLGRGIDLTEREDYDREREDRSAGNHYDFNEYADGPDEGDGAHYDYDEDDQDDFDGYDAEDDGYDANDYDD